LEDEIPLVEVTTNLWVQTIPKVETVEIDGKRDSLKNLLKKIRERLNSVKSGNPCVVLDSLSTICLQFELRDVFAFLLSMLGIVKKSPAKTSLFIRLT